MLSARETSYRIVFRFEQDKERLDVLFAALQPDLKTDSRNRRFIRNLTSGTIRHLLYLDWIAAQLYHGNYKKMLNKTRILLRLALYEIIFMEAVPERASINEYVQLSKKKLNYKTSQLVNGLLRNYLRKRDELNPVNLIKDPLKRISVTYSFPEWMVQRWIGFWGMEEAERLCKALNKPPKFDLQINQAAISTAEFIKLLEQHKIKYTPSHYFPNMLAVEDFQQIIKLGWLNQGLCSVQDESAAIPVQALNPSSDDMVLDVCAAPGGKYLQILQSNPAFAVAMDMNIKRLKRVKENVNRLNLKTGHFVCADGRHPPFKPIFTKILLDAPCSGLGVIRKHPDIKWRRKFSEIIEFSNLQKVILSNSTHLLQDGGRMTYSTCTIDPLENENVLDVMGEEQSWNLKVIEPMVKLNTFKSENLLHTFPQEHGMDGSFCALLQKNSE